MPLTAEWPALLSLALLVFASTNIDDILLLAAFFSDRALKPQHVVLGQFLGISVLVAASAAAATLALVVPAGWLALLGVLPLALGVRALLARWRNSTDEGDDGSDSNPRLQNARSAGALPQMAAVASVTVANGGDNLGIYVPLFATQPQYVAVFAAVFAAMTALWCALGYALVNNRWVGERVQRIASAALPWVLIGLGLYILSGARMLL